MAIDFVNPDVPRALKIVNRLARPFAWALLPLDPERLIRTAQDKTGLRDLGDDGFRRPLRILMESLESEARLNLLGRLHERQLLLMACGIAEAYG